MAKIKLIAFFGNYGPEYANTRHNAGWLFCDALSYAGDLRWQKKFKGEFAQIERPYSDGGDPVYFLKPLTYMNLSGQSVHELAQFYKIKLDEILVVHDELELPCGTVSLKFGGGLGGHNGLRSMRDSFGSADCWRLRFGIGRPNHNDIAGYVLQPFTDDERIILSQAYPAVEDMLKKLLTRGPESQLQDWKKKNLKA